MKFYANDILNHYSILLKALSSPSLTTVQKGTLEDLPPPSSLSTWLPAVLMQVTDESTSQAPEETGAAMQTQYYGLRFVFVRKWTASEKIYEKDIDYTEDIAEAIQDDFLALQRVRLTDGNITGGVVTGIIYDYDGGTFREQYELDLRTSAIEVVIEVLTSEVPS